MEPIPDWQSFILSPNSYFISPTSRFLQSSTAACSRRQTTPEICQGIISSFRVPTILEYMQQNLQDKVVKHKSRMNGEDLGVNQPFWDCFIDCPMNYSLAGASLQKSYPAFQIMTEIVLFLKKNFYVPHMRKLYIDLFIVEIHNYHCHHYSFWSLWWYLVLI